MSGATANNGAMALLELGKVRVGRSQPKSKRVNPDHLKSFRMCEAYRKGDDRARGRILDENKNLAIVVLRHIQGFGYKRTLHLEEFEESDIFAFCFFGLHLALMNYRPLISFGSYAYSVIKQRAIDEMRQYSKVPRPLRDRMRRLRTYEGDNSKESIMEFLGMRKEIAYKNFLQCMDVHWGNPSLDLVIENVHTSALSNGLRFMDKEEAAQNLYDRVPDGQLGVQESFERSEISRIVREVVASIKDDRFRGIAELYFFESWAGHKIAEKYNVTESRIFQILKHDIKPYLKKRLADYGIDGVG